MKLVTRTAEGRIQLRLLPREAIVQVAHEVESCHPQGVGLTGGGAGELASLLPFDTARVSEFDAWPVGAGQLLRRAGAESAGRYLLASVGTGTSVLLVDGAKATRVGGTALGGGTLVGLGAGLVGESDFETLSALAARGDRRRVDLLVREVGDVPLPGDVTASSLAKLARPGFRADPADLAHAIMGLVGENVALVCNALAAAHGVKRVVFAGTTLRGNRALADILCGLTTVLGHEPWLLEEGEYAGAFGALALCEPA